MTPAEFIARKVPVPSEMLTRDWDRVQAAVRERSFFMASVVQHEILDAYQDGSRALAAGEVNAARAGEIVQERLRAMGYAPATGTEGSIKDLSSWRRLRVTLQTNRDLAQGYAGHLRALKTLAVYPAKRMVRQTVKREPRDWPGRWREVAGTVPAVGMNVADMSAHVTHPVWRAISRFGLPYPIYDFGSGMGDRILGAKEAKELGVHVAPPAGPTDAEEPAMNADMQAAPDVRNEEVKASLEEAFKGAAEWQDDRLVYLDPNGTRPDTAERLARIIRSRPETDSPTWQADAVDAYAADGPGMAPGSDALYDLARLVRRTVPMERPPVLWHGRRFANEMERDIFVESLQAGEATLAAPGWPFWDSDPDAGKALDAVADADGVMVSIRGAEGARDLRPSLGDSPRPGVFLETGFRLKVSKIETLGRIVNIVAEWIGGAL